MSEIQDLRDLQREYIENRDSYYSRIKRQDQNLRNYMPSSSDIRQSRENEARWRAEADKWQARIDAIQAKLDEVIGL